MEFLIFYNNVHQRYPTVLLLYTTSCLKNAYYCNGKNMLYKMHAVVNTDYGIDMI